MATYEYKCGKCGGHQEIEKPIGSDWIPVCCEQSMERVWSPTPTIFKAGGFYKTGG
jgi:predicted nucleic acid-binding Zn ribbon protein